MKNEKSCGIFRFLSGILALALAVATGLFFGCENRIDPPYSTAETVTDRIEVGEGTHTFFLTVTDLDGTSAYFSVHTDQTVLGRALLALGLVEGEEGPFGLYVKKVNGILADYDDDGSWWGLYIDGTLSSVGIDAVDITEGAEYALVRGR